MVNSRFEKPWSDLTPDEQLFYVYLLFSLPTIGFFLGYAIFSYF